MIVEKFCRNATTVEKTTTLCEAAEIMKSKDVDSLVVIENKQPVGFVTCRDIVTRGISNRWKESVPNIEKIMTCKPFCIRETSPVSRAVEKMNFYRVDRLIVVNSNQQVVGIVAREDMHGLYVELKHSLNPS